MSKNSVETFRQCGAQPESQMGYIKITNPETGCRVEVHWVHPDDMILAQFHADNLCSYISKRGQNNIEEKYRKKQKAIDEQTKEVGDDNPKS